MVDEYKTCFNGRIIAKDREEAVKILAQIESTLRNKFDFRFESYFGYDEIDVNGITKEPWGESETD